MSHELVPSATTRPLSGFERIWLVADRVAGPFVNQLVIEGRGTLTLEALRGAVNAVWLAQPWSAMKLRGVLGWTRWQSMAPMPELSHQSVSLCRAPLWEGRSHEGAPFLRRPLSPSKGPSVEVLLVESDESHTLKRLVIRTHHALMDGGGARIFAEDLFAHLRGEPCRGSATQGPTDAKLAANVGASSGTTTPQAIYVAPTGAAKGRETHWAWCRRTLEGAPPRGILYQTIALLAQHASSGPLRIGVPVDLRRHLPDGTRLNNNLTGILHVTFEPGQLTPAETLPSRVRDQILDGLRDHAEGTDLLSAERARWMPLSLMAFLGKAAGQAQIRRGLYPVSASISNLGRQPLSSFGAPGVFDAQALYWIPPPTMSLPLFLTLSGHDHGVEIVGGSPASLASEGRLESLVEALRDGLALITAS